MKDSEVFEMARVIIDVNGWSQGVWKRHPTGEVCIEAAISMAISDNAFLGADYALAGNKDFEQAKRCQYFLENKVLHGMRAFGWNDCNGRTVEEVQLVLGLAADLMKSAEEVAELRELVAA